MPDVDMKLYGWLHSFFEMPILAKKVSNLLLPFSVHVNNCVDTYWPKKSISEKKQKERTKRRMVGTEQKKRDRTKKS